MIEKLINKNVKIVLQNGDFISVVTVLIKDYDSNTQFLEVVDKKKNYTSYINIHKIHKLDVLED